MISVVILTYNEEDNILSIINDVKTQQFAGDYEIIVADGNSKDRTVELAMSQEVQVLKCRKGKAYQMNEAARIAKGDILFFVHADMQLSDNVLSSIQNSIVNRNFDGGGFANIFDKHNKRIKKLGTWLNFRFFHKQEQSDKGIFYGDNGIFVRKSVFEILGGFREIAIMEDYDFSIRMRNQFRTEKIYEPCLIVSARRHQKDGFLKTRLLWILIRILYRWGVSPRFLVKYYKDVR